MWNLVYADDIVLVARNKKVLQDMTTTFNRFLTKKRMEYETNLRLVYNKKR